jgi:hypothetical protein
LIPNNNAPGNIPGAFLYRTLLPFNDVRQTGRAGQDLIVGFPDPVQGIPPCNEGFHLNALLSYEPHGEKGGENFKGNARKLI